MVNKTVGNRFEKDFCQSLAAYGYWAHNMAQNQQGQPFDVIAAKNGKTYVIDCKDCERNVFRLSRIEDNQEQAMKLWSMCGNGVGWFALRLADGSVYMFSLYSLICLRNDKVSLPEKYIRMHGKTLKDWVDENEN